MATTYNRLLIDVNQKIDNIVTAKQNDTASRFLDVSLYSNGVPINLTGHSVKIYFKKPDNTEVFTEGEITDATAGRCQFELTTQTLAVYGDLKAEISIWNGDTEVLTTQTFTIIVFEMLRSDNTVESTNEFGVLVTLFQSIQNSLDAMNAIKTNFGEAGEKAAEYNATTFWEMLEVLAGRTEEAIQLDISGKIGSTDDAESSSATTGSIFAKLNYLVNQIKTFLSLIYTFTSRIGNTTDTGATATTGSVLGKLNYLIGNRGIKSIQRGTTNVSSSGVAITISTIDPSKSILLIDGGSMTYQYSAGAYLNGLGATGFNLYASNAGVSVKVSWQVIEFY